jgi:hypothetical protein
MRCRGRERFGSKATMASRFGGPGNQDPPDGVPLRHPGKFGHIANKPDEFVTTIE